MLAAADPNRGWTLERNPRFARLGIPDIPTGHLDRIRFEVTSNTQLEAQQVLDGQADVFDAGDTLPPALLPRIEAKARDRFAKLPSISTYYFFLNTTTKPFDNPLARRAVAYAIDRRALARLASGFLKPECFYVPEGLVGHPDGPCPYGSLDGRPQLAKAKQLVKRSGLAGTAVTVWGMQRSPRREFVDYYTQLLDEIGFKATEKIVADAAYFPTVGNARTAAQTGFADWISALPSPSDFYLPLDGRSIQPTNSVNVGRVNDPHVQTTLERLGAVPFSELAAHARAWQALDRYTAARAYAAVFGTGLLPKFYSDRLDFDAAIFHPVYWNDYTSLRLR
jgi:peptide/nickel transport system substrate-binding protein